ncbi:type I-E CRISPR-associated protein Cse1/CasA [Derxia gummosa]|uniref:Type I-E CRISPR-associated protein Cse1/CasA n=1 Tax=Derxia gummosa DSM 723 TaxID=1121388 RepID=A0A8B6XA82_9BURK|nr:type I-E CRISPR-associated protein Cse1/CasA [Derxia gummosa]
MSLLDERWMHVRLRDGGRALLAPFELSRPDTVAFDAARPDFNGALFQFAVALLQTITPARTRRDWRAWFAAPPDADTLRALFEPIAPHFVYDGDGARFMQDHALRAADGEPVAIANLLIDSPGENALRNNGDFFTKRGRISRLCPHCAVLALYTLQVNAPSGGAGHRTGLRGGGPLTTLLRPETVAGEPASLWQQLWLNVLPESQFNEVGGDRNRDEPIARFPWRGPIEQLQSDGGSLAPTQVHPLHVYWAMPRRIRLDLDAVAQGTCDLCGATSDRLVTQYVTRNYGLNYKGAWNHPLSPYYQVKDEWLPLHPQPGGIGYRHWQGFVLGIQADKQVRRAAKVVTDFLDDGIERNQRVELRLWAFGYDMDNMKPRCWYESVMPLHAIGECGASERELMRGDIAAWVAGAELAASYARNAVKDAWFGGDARGDYGFIDASFWSRTEPDFYALLRERIAAARDGGEWDAVARALAWRSLLRRTALRLFDDELVGAGAVHAQNPARIKAAHEQLTRNLDGPKLRDVLHLPAPAGSAKPKPARKTGRKAD